MTRRIENFPSNKPLGEDFQAWEKELTSKESPKSSPAPRESSNDDFRMWEQELQTPDASSGKPVDIDSDDFESVRTEGRTKKIGRSALAHTSRLVERTSTALRNEANATLNGYVAVRKARNERRSRRRGPLKWATEPFIHNPAFAEQLRKTKASRTAKRQAQRDREQ